MKLFPNPFKPGAGHPPPYLAGREDERLEFERLLSQETVLENLVLSGLRGVGKTVLLESFKPLALASDWLWVGADVSEAATHSEEALATRLLVDLSVVTSTLRVRAGSYRPAGFQARTSEDFAHLTYDTLMMVYQNTPGLIADKLKAVLELAWAALQYESNRRDDDTHGDDSDRASVPVGVIFAYDEAQNLADQAADKEYPLSLLLDVFQSLQRKGVRFMLVLTGLPTLFPKLVAARTYAERMFRVVFLKSLNEAAAREAVLKPTSKSPIHFSNASVEEIVRTSGGYPYFIQFICREVFDVYLASMQRQQVVQHIALDAILRKLDTDFFAGRWARATDRQRDLLALIAQLDGSDDEFAVQDIVERSNQGTRKPFGASQVSQMLGALAEGGLVYRNRHGRYAFAVPLFGQFVLRQVRP